MEIDFYIIINGEHIILIEKLFITIANGLTFLKEIQFLTVNPKSNGSNTNQTNNAAIDGGNKTIQQISRQKYNISEIKNV